MAEDGAADADEKAGGLQKRQQQQNGGAAAVAGKGQQPKGKGASAANLGRSLWAHHTDAAALALLIAFTAALAVGVALEQCHRWLRAIWLACLLGVPGWVGEVGVWGGRGAWVAATAATASAAAGAGARAGCARMLLGEERRSAAALPSP